jgi:hypothetical protein
MLGEIKRGFDGLEAAAFPQRREQGDGCPLNLTFRQWLQSRITPEDVARPKKQAAIMGEVDFSACSGGSLSSQSGRDWRAKTWLAG